MSLRGAPAPRLSRSATSKRCVRYSAAQLEGWIGAAGFRKMGSLDWLDNSFFLVFH